MDIYDVIKIAGIITLVLLFITFIFGFFNIKIKNRFLMHRWFGIITLICGLIHGAIVFYVYYIK